MKSVIYRKHAVQRMFERKITAQQVEQLILSGEVIQEYPDDVPYPSRLVLGLVQGKPLHVVVAESEDYLIVITAYEPDPAIWDASYRGKR